MGKTRIITDIRITQSPLWAKKTDFVGNISSGLLKFFPTLSDKLPVRLKPFHNALTILKNIRKYDIVITANIRTGQLVALLRKLFNVKNTKQIILEVMLDEKANNITWNIKRMIQQFIFSLVDVIFVSSYDEVEKYSKRFTLLPGRFRFLHFHTNIIDPKIVPSPKSYILSAGRTGRDYHVLAQAVNHLPVDIVVISDHNSIRGINFPDNTKILINISWHKYLELLQKCWFVVVPLQELVKSTGQVVILEAMALGKPVIASEAVGTSDYINSGHTGILVPPDDPLSLRKAICSLLNNQHLQEEISLNALKFIKENCTFDIYVRKILDTAEEIASSKSIQ
jgi:glycosyltransferase involved in cell wall biosynthesis